MLLVPGGAFNIDSSEPSSYVRASFSLPSAAQMDLVRDILFYILINTVSPEIMLPCFYFTLYVFLNVKCRGFYYLAD